MIDSIAQRCSSKEGKMCTKAKEKLEPATTTYMKILMDLMETLKTVVTSSEAHLYMMVNDKLFRVIQGHCTAYPTGWKPGLGTIVAAHVAHTKIFFVTNDGLDETMFRYGVGRKGAHADKILAIPIADPKGKVFGVLEFSRHYEEPSYTQEEIDMAVSICAWAATSIYRNATKSLIVKDEMFLEDMLFTLEMYASSKLDFTSYISTTMEYIQKNIKADGVIYSEIIQSEPYVVIDYYKKDDDAEHLERSNKKRCLDSFHDSALLYCLKTADIYRRTEYALIDEEQKEGNPKHLIYESVLYCPVFVTRKPAGVAVFWKRDIKGGFTWYDELVTSNSLGSLLVAYNIHGLSNRNFTKRLMCRNIFDTVINQLKPNKHDYVFLDRLFSSQPKFPENFFKFSFYPRKDETQLDMVKYSIDMLRLILGQGFFVKNPRLGEFLIMVARNYRDKPYHNFEHAFVTMHSMFNILIRNKDKMYPYEVVSLLIATICHDMDHPGYSNAYLKLIDSYMWQLYQEAPILEYHHSYFALYLIQHCDLFCHMPKDKYKLVLHQIKDNILATDLTTHFRVKSNMFEMVAENGFQWADPEHREGLKSILMTTCDLSAAFKAPQNAVQIICNLYAEFYSQGDLEKKRGVTPLMAMDRTMADNIPQGQITFLSMICLPCFELVKEIIPNCDEIVTSSLKLLEFWRKQVEEKEGRIPLVIPNV